MKLFHKRTSWLFLIILLLVSILYNYHEILFYPPYSIHVWRQTDCLSITLNFYKEHLSFFTPKINWTNENGDNYTISEFPLIYYTVAQLWKIFGQREFIFRLIDILFVFTGLFSLFKLSRAYLQDKFWAIYIPIFLFTSPILVYYANNFTADAPALGMALTAAYFYWSYHQNRKMSFLILSIVSIVLAGLLKISSLILFTAFLSLTVLNTLVKKQGDKPKLKEAMAKFWPFGVVIILVAMWYLYARHFTKEHFSGIFLQSIYPIWDLNPAQRHDISNSLYWKLLPAFFNRTALEIVILLGISTIFISYKKSKDVIHLYLISLFGILLFILLWFKAFDVHDYYLTNLLFIVPFSLLLFLGALKGNYQKVFKHWVLKLVAMLGLLFLVYQTTFINRIKYNAHDPWRSIDVLTDKNAADYWAGKQWRYSKTIKALETITPYLRELGISRDDLVYSTPDNTINHTLYLMDQRGFTDYGYVPYKGLDKLNERIEYFKQIGAKYLILNSDKNIQYIDKKYLSHLIGTYQNVFIYKLE